MCSLFITISRQREFVDSFPPSLYACVLTCPLKDEIRGVENWAQIITHTRCVLDSDFKFVDLHDKYIKVETKNNSSHATFFTIMQGWKLTKENSNKNTKCVNF